MKICQIKLKLENVWKYQKHQLQIPIYGSCDQKHWPVTPQLYRQLELSWMLDAGKTLRNHHEAIISLN